MLEFDSVRDTRSGACRVAFELRMGRRSRRLYVTSSRGPLSSLADFTLPLVLAPAMFHGAGIEVRGPISRHTAVRLPATMRYLAKWDSRLKPIAVQAPVVERDVPVGDCRAATFFSGGVDSFFTLLAHRDDISALVFFHGFDIRLEDRELRKRAAAAIHESGSELGLEVLEIESNWRSLLDEYVEWEPQGHRLYMASAGLLLAPQFQRLYVPAGYVSDDLVPARTDPDFYPTWSRLGLELSPDGVGVKRVEKARAVVKNETALRHLRVCWENRGGAYNCGRCEKCLRTMATLRILRVLDRCPTFERPLDLDALASVHVYDDSLFAYLEENLELVRQEGADPDLERALKACLAPRGGLEQSLRRAQWLAQRLALSSGRRAMIANAARKRTHLW